MARIATRLPRPEAPRVAAFSGKDGDVFEAAQGSKEHLAEEGEGAEVDGRRGDGKRRVVDMRVAGERPQRKQDESGKDDEDGDTAGVVDPLAKLQAAVSSEGDAGKHEDDDGQAEQAILWQAARSRADEVGNLRWDGVEDG
ncbi:MAG: hypothetical protein WAM56_17795, partial [Acidobacteriaceae bacterium]